MKVVQFTRHGSRHVGVVRDGDVFDVTDRAPTALELLLSGSDPGGGELVGHIDALNHPNSRGARLRIPVDPPEVWGAGVTYKKSAEFRDEDTTTSKGIYDMVYSAARPELFYKGRAAHCVGPNEAATIRVDSSFTAPEPELAVVVSAGGKIVGYTLCDDVSAWDIERENPLYLPQSKIFYGCVVLGPAVVTPDEAGDVAALNLKCRILRGGNVLFEDAVGLDRMKRSIEELVGFLRLNNPILDGTVLTTGTGIIVSEKEALAQGDVVELECGPIGTLRHSMRKLSADWVPSPGDAALPRTP